VRRQSFRIGQLVLAVALALATLGLAADWGTAAAGSLANLPQATSGPAQAKAAPPKTSTGKLARASKTSEAAPADQPGKIALMTSVGGAILLLDPATGQLQHITEGIDPAFSPDGSMLAFTRWGTAPGLWVRDMKTGQERQVTGAQKPRHPTWSSDGKKLAFVRNLTSTTCRESVFGCHSEELMRAFFGGQDCGDTYVGRLCISSMPIVTVDTTGLVEVGLDGTGWQDIPAPTDAQSVSWRPNSEDLLYRGNNRLQMTTPNGRPWDAWPEQWFSSPIWSPDGTKFLAQQRIQDHDDIALFDQSGAIINYLTKPPSVSERNPHNVAPAWSPDGKTILFLTDREGARNWKLYRMNADGSGQAPFMPEALKDVKLRYDFSAERVVSWGR
jgi:dipeptidyl aminopeptidase/acylaminoacyl peptidase